MATPMSLFTAKLFLFAFTLTQINTTGQKTSYRSFEIDYGNNTFLKDGRPFRYVSGSFHYSRVHLFYWQDRLLKTRASGVNVIQVYVPWNVHEMSPGHFTWSGSSDLPKFLALAQEADLGVLLRLGPYICGEWEFGGFPAWLLTENPRMNLRTSDPSYMQFVDRWFTALLAKVKPFLYKNGGPVLMVQTENEYGSYFACDFPYLKYLRDKVWIALGEDTVIYSTDGNDKGFLKCGKNKGVYATVDFGIIYDPVKAFSAQRQFEPKGPLVNSEFYTGWLDHWGSQHSTVDTVSLARSLDLLLNYTSFTNINMYMFVGGTNFGFTNGANSPTYQPVPTSYDYDSPISEAGDITPKYYAVRDIISKYLPLPSMAIPPNTKKAQYGPMPMEFVMTVQDALKYLTPLGPTKSTHPVPMEKIKFYYGFIMYRFTLKKDTKTPSVISTKGVRDRAIVMVNHVPFGLLDRDNVTVNITGSTGQAVDILVENMGRINYGSDILNNTKGLIEDVTLDGVVVTDWEIYPLYLENINDTLGAIMMKKGRKRAYPKTSADGKLMTPSIYVGSMVIPDQASDTFLDPTSWGKGQAIMNGFNLGRYWPGRGPQVTLYVPAPVLVNAPKTNYLFMFELETAPCGQGLMSKDPPCQVLLSDTPCLDGPNGPDNSIRERKMLLDTMSDVERHLVH